MCLSMPFLLFIILALFLAEIDIVLVFICLLGNAKSHFSKGNHVEIASHKTCLCIFSEAHQRVTFNEIEFVSIIEINI